MLKKFGRRKRNRKENQQPRTDFISEKKYIINRACRKKRILDDVSLSSVQIGNNNQILVEKKSEVKSRNFHHLIKKIQPYTKHI